MSASASRLALVSVRGVVAAFRGLTLVGRLACALVGLLGRGGRGRARQQDQHQAAGVFATGHSVASRSLRTEGVTRE
jgi:hypothetical protein